MANRTFYAVHAVGVAPPGSNTFTDVHGVQSIGITTTFNLEQVFELGQIEIYENIEGVPDIEVTMEKVLDGYCPIYLLCTQNAVSASLSGRSAKKATVALSIFDDQQNSASGTPLAQVTMSGLAVSAVTYSFPVDGSFTESVTLVGNDKTWKTAAFTYTPNFTNDDEPKAIAGSGGVNRREDMLFSYTGTTTDANGAIIDTGATVLPGKTGGKVQGISSSGTNNKTNDVFGAHIQGITVSTDLGREEIFELGRRTPYFRFVTFPTEVTTEIEVLSTQGDLVEATEAGVLGDGNNLANQTIRVATKEGLRLNLGTKNKLQSVSYSDGDVGGSNVVLRYSYSNFNSLEVKHVADVTTGLRP